LSVGVYNNHPTLEHTTDHLDTRPILKKSKNEFGYTNVVLRNGKKSDNCPLNNFLKNRFFL
jgi:hypothetical protein